jgi:hypothetical protein
MWRNGEKLVWNGPKKTKSRVMLIVRRIVGGSNDTKFPLGLGAFWLLIPVDAVPLFEVAYGGRLMILERCRVLVRRESDGRE